MRLALTSLDRRILGLAVPALGALIVEPLYNVTDTAIVGHLGKAPLGGLALAAAVLNLLGWTSAFLQMATTSQVAYRRGQDDEQGVTAAVTAAYVVALALGLLVAVLVAVVGPELTRLLGGHGEVQRNATTYLRISAVGMPFLLLTLAGTGHAQGHEDTRSPLRIVLIANVVNVFLEVLLVYGFHLGVAGSAWGTVVAQVVAAAMFTYASRRRITSAIVGVATMVLSPVLPYVFTGDSDVRSHAVIALLLCGALQPFAAIAFVLDGLLLGASAYAALRRSMILALLAFAPFAVATLLDHRLGIVGVWLAITCWLAARCALLGRHWRRLLPA